MIIPIEPMGKPRQTQRDRWAKRPVVERYHAFSDALRLHWGRGPYIQVPARLSMRFNISMPPSWSQKKKNEMDGQPHQQRPDIDNLVKSVMDSLCTDDSYIFAIRGEKYWATEGSIEVRGY